MTERGGSFFSGSQIATPQFPVSTGGISMSPRGDGEGTRKSREGFFKLMAYWKSFLPRPFNSQRVRYDNYMMLIFGTFWVSESSAPKVGIKI